jgi:UDP-N-acetylglucosamine 2-epimerase (non-hydrolysing)
MAARDDRLHLDGVDGVDFERDRVVLVTAHRRENWGEPLKNICAALKELVRKYDDVAVVFPVHLNPNVRRTVYGSLQGLHRIHLIEPLDYLAFVGLMKRAHLILTDSGGIQEEAPSLGKPVLVLRTTTERPEASLGGTAMIVGTGVDDIVANVARLLDDAQLRERMSRPSNPYGDGQAARRIVSTIRRLFGLEQSALI